MNSHKKTNQAQKTRADKNDFLILFNYFYLVLLGSGIAIGFLPIRTLKDIDEIAWTYPAALTAVFLTCFFLFINRKAIPEILAEIFSIPLKKTISGQSPVEPFRGPVPPKYILCLSVLIITAFMIFSYRLGEKNFWDDEYLTLKAAKGYQETGTYSSWDFIQNAPTPKKYKRAWPHTFLVAQSYKMFGVSEWSTRIVSVVFGCLFIALSFFLNVYFTGNIFLSFIISTIFTLNPDFIYYWRYARMYAILLPTFYLWAFLIYKSLEGQPEKVIHKKQKTAVISNYLNFNWKYVGLSLVVFYFAYLIHITPMILLPAALIYIFTVGLIEKNYKYIGLFIIIGVASFIAYPLIPENIISGLTVYLLFFKAYNPIYLHLITQRPFYSIINLSLLSGSILIAFFAPQGVIKRKILFCTFIVLTTIVFFIYMANFYSNHYRFIIQTVPFAILLVSFVYFIILKIFNNKYILVAGMALLVLSQANNWMQLQRVLYHGAAGQPFPSIAYQTVKNNLKNDDVIFAQGLKDYYMAGIPADTPIISLGYLQKQDAIGTNPYHFEHFFNDIRKYKHGWVIWEKYKEYHINRKVAAYVKTLFHQYHGQGIDNTGVEVFYFDESMIKKPNFK